MMTMCGNFKLQTILLFCTFVFHQLQQVDSYAKGAPVESCGDMIPQHDNHTIQTSVPPYKLVPSSRSVSGGKRIVLKLVADEGYYMEGFFIQARETEDGDPIGTFYSDSFNIFTCGQGNNNAITQTDHTKLTSVSIEWEAPSGFKGDIVFRATVVKGFATFWTNLRSEKVTVIN